MEATGDATLPGSALLTPLSPSLSVCVYVYTERPPVGGSGLPSSPVCVCVCVYTPVELG